MSTKNRIVIEQGPKKAFASALDWPGWSRKGNSEDDAINVLIQYLDRYRKVTELAGVNGIDALVKSPDVVEHVKGTGATDFGVPDKVAQIEYEWMTAAEADRQIAILRACWDYFDDIGTRVSAELQKGPRGGGRNRDEIVAHTIEADRGYARQIGVKTEKSAYQSRSGVAAHRKAVVDAIRQQNADRVETKWPLRYFIRRAAWHLLDHAWEMEDKDLTGAKDEATT